VAFFFAPRLSRISSAVGLHLCGWRAKKEERELSYFIRPICALIVLALAADFSIAATFERIALTGQQAPGAPAGTTFTRFRGPFLDADGNVAFTADTSAFSNDGAWRFTNAIAAVPRSRPPPPPRPPFPTHPRGSPVLAIGTEAGGNDGRER
jgi:hypothetical protein